MALHKSEAALCAHDVCPCAVSFITPAL